MKSTTIPDRVPLDIRATEIPVDQSPFKKLVNQWRGVPGIKLSLFWGGTKDTVGTKIMPGTGDRSGL